MIPCFELDHWSKFERNPIRFGGVIRKKPPKSSLKSTFLVLAQHLKIYNFGFTNAILMKLTTSMYKHETFDLAKKLGRHPQGVEGRGPKTYEKKLKVGFFAPILTISSQLNKTCEISAALLCTA